MQRTDVRRLATTILGLGGPGHARVPLATTRRVEIGRWQAMRNPAFFLDDEIAPAELRTEHDPDHALPPHAVTDIYELSSRPSPRVHYGLGHCLLRSEPVLDAVGGHERLVLLGEPGAGKTTLLRDLAGSAGRSVTRLHQLAGAWPALHRPDSLLGPGSAGARPGRLLLDGLDEIPVNGDTGPGRREVARAVIALAARHPHLPIVVSCRATAFADVGDVLDWPVAVLAPLTLGQIRHLIAALVADLARNEPAVPRAAAAQAALLVSACAELPWLLELMRTPLAVALITLVTLESGRVPDHPGQACDPLRRLMLVEWDAARGLPDLAAFAGEPGWSTAQAGRLLDRLGHQAHRAAPESGRGRLPAPDAGEHSRWEALAERTGMLVRTSAAPGDWSAPQLRELGARQHSLLIDPEVAFDAVSLPPSPAPTPVGPATRRAARLGFVALTLQEDACTRYLAAQDDPVAAALVHRDGERWVEPIVQLATVLDPAALVRLLDRLVRRPAAEGDVAAERCQRDIVLAARLLAAPSARSTRALPGRAAAELLVRQGLVHLLSDVNQPLLEGERIEAADLLGRCGDPRYPVSPTRWRAEVGRAVAGAGDGYFCRVEAGPYWIGAGSVTDPGERQGDEWPLHRVDLPVALHLARYPITWEQWRAWPGAGTRSDGSPAPRANEPVTAGWRSADGFCRWLSEQLGATIRLPSEFEWEAAARGGDRRESPWGDRPSDDRAWTFDSRARRGLLHARATVPVGCYPAGAAPCGALDLAGNVGEWTSSTWRAYPGAAVAFDDPPRHVQRGGGYGETHTGNGCAARRAPGDHDRTAGLRVVLVP